MALSLAARQARLATLRDLINAQGGGAIHLYAAPMAARPEDAPAGAPLAIVALAVNCGVLGAVGNVASFTFFPAQGNAALNGVVAWARFVDGVGTAVYDAPAGLPSENLTVAITDNKTPPSGQVYAGGEVQIAAAVLTE